MKKITSFLNLLAVSVALFAGVNPANAAFRSVGPLSPVHGMPLWYQDVSGMALKPCTDQTGLCPAFAEAFFNPGAIPFTPITTTGPINALNFPSEVFYYNAVAVQDINVTGGFKNGVPAPGTPAKIVILMAIEANPLVNPSLTFMRINMQKIAAGLVPGGVYTVTLPFGAGATFTFTADPITAASAGAAGGVGGVFAGQVFRNNAPSFTPFTGFIDGIFPAIPPNQPAPFTMDSFLISQTAPLGFAGDPRIPGPVVHAGTLLPAVVTITGPGIAAGAGTITQIAVAGQMVGLLLTPPAVVDAGVTKVGVGGTSAPMAFTVKNLTGLPITTPGFVFTPTVAGALADFAVVPGLGCAPIISGGTCTFSVTFTPTADGLQSAVLTVSDAAATPTVPPVTAKVSGIGDGTPPTLTVSPLPFTNTLTPTLSGTVFDANGVPPTSVQITVGTAPPVAATITAGAAGAPSTWSKAITLPLANAANNISVTAIDNALPGGNITPAAAITITHDNIKPVVAPTITPVPNGGGFITTKSPTLTPGVSDANPIISTIVTVDTTAPSSNVTPATLPLGPLGEGSHTVKVDALDAASNPATVSIAFNVDTIKPVITITSPVITAAGTIGVSSPTMIFTIDDANPNSLATTATFDSFGATPSIPAPLHHPIAFSTDALGKVSGTVTLVDPNAVNPDIVPNLTEGETHTMTFDTTDLAGNIAATKTVTFTLLLRDGSMTTLGATPPTIADVVLALKVALGGFPEVANINPTSDKFKHGDVAPLGANGKPAPDGKIDLNDVLTILKKVVGLTTTF